MDGVVRPDAARTDSGGSTDSDDFPVSLTHRFHDQGFDSELPSGYQAGGVQDEITPLTDISASPSWSSGYPQSRTRGPMDVQESQYGTVDGSAVGSPKPTRPGGPARQISSTYQPPRNPLHRPPHILPTSGKHRSYSASRDARPRRDPNAQYRAQEKAYIDQLRQNPYDYFGREPYTPSLDTSVESDHDALSPSPEVQFDNEIYDQDTQLFFNNESDLPSLEEMQMPGNRERLEWHGMLASVLNGDVVRQEKQRLEGPGKELDNSERRQQLWVGARAKLCGRTEAAQRRLLEEGRAASVSQVEDIINFEIKGEAEAGKPAEGQIQDVVERIEKIEHWFPCDKELRATIEKTGSEAYVGSTEALIAWHNTTEMINTELSILKAWVGNDELDFSKVNTDTKTGAALKDDLTFLDRLHKDESLVSLQGTGDKPQSKQGLLVPLAKVIGKAKKTLIENADQFAKRHLPPYMEELLTLINFPSRLIQEIIRMRLNHVGSLKDPASMEPMMQAQMISQFRILLDLAMKVKIEYTMLSAPERGWDLPPCIDDNFDSVVVDALKFYLKMLNAKLVGNRTTFKEADILDSEYDFCKEVGQQLDGGDVEVAEQFCGLTARALHRLSHTCEKELTRPPEKNALDISRRYKALLDSVRVRQRKLMRFSKTLSENFENASEYNISLDDRRMHELYDALVDSQHFLIESPSFQHEGIYLLGSPSLYGDATTIQSLLGTRYKSSEKGENQKKMEDPRNPYILILRPDEPFRWDGRRLDVTMRAPSMDIRLGRLRLVADGSLQRLQTARSVFVHSIGLDLNILVEVRANLSRVKVELGKIKTTAYKLSMTIMESVEIIRGQTKGLDNQELIHTCFSFATEFGTRSKAYLDTGRRMMINMKLTRLALDWVGFICDDCIASDRKTFKWAVSALEFAMKMTQGSSILSITDEEFSKMCVRVAGCMSLLISHFDIMGAKSTLAAQAAKRRDEASGGSMRKMDISKMKDDAEASKIVREQWVAALHEFEEKRVQKLAERQRMGRVMEDTSDADRSLTYLSSTATNITMQWQLGQYVGGGTFGSVYAAYNLDSGNLMAVKEIRLQDPQLIPTVAGQIRDEQAVLEVLDHPNIVSYYGIEVHRDKVYIFMEYCSGGSLAALLEHGRIEDETVIQVYALQLLEGLAYLHQSNITHRDIKPESKSSSHPSDPQVLFSQYVFNPHQTSFSTTTA